MFEILSQSIADIDYVKKDETTRRIRDMNDSIVIGREPQDSTNTHIMCSILKGQWQAIVENIQKLTTLVRS